MQEPLQAILNSMPQVVVFVDNDHIIRFMNTAAERHYAKRGGADLLGKSLMKCHRPASGEKIRAIHQRLQAGEQQVLVTEKPNQTIYAVAVRDAAGDLLGYYERYDAKPLPADVSYMPEKGPNA